MNFNVKKTFFKKLSRKIWGFSMHVKHKSLISVVEKNYPVNNNYMFKIDIKSTRTRCEICSELTIKMPRLFFHCWLWTCTRLLGTYYHFYCLGDFHYLDHFQYLHHLQKKWNLVYILKLAYGWLTYRFSYAMGHNDAHRCGAATNDILKLMFMYCNLLLL